MLVFSDHESNAGRKANNQWPFRVNTIQQQGRGRPGSFFRASEYRQGFKQYLFPAYNQT